MPGVSFCMFISDTVTLCLSRFPLQWRHNERGGVSNHQPHVCLRKRLLKPQIKENIKAPRHWPLCVEFTGDRWIPRTMDQWRGICFPLMSSSCVDDRPLMCSNYLTDTHGLLCFILLWLDYNLKWTHISHSCIADTVIVNLTRVLYWRDHIITTIFISYILNTMIPHRPVSNRTKTALFSTELGQLDILGSMVRH